MSYLSISWIKLTKPIPENLNKKQRIVCCLGKKQGNKHMNRISKKCEVKKLEVITSRAENNYNKSVKVI